MQRAARFAMVSLSLALGLPFSCAASTRPRKWLSDGGLRRGAAPQNGRVTRLQLRKAARARRERGYSL